MSETTKKSLLAAYSVLDKFYTNGCVMQIRGRPAYDRGNVLSVKNPSATYVPLAVNMADPKLLPFAFAQDPVVLIPKVTTPMAGQPSTCKYDLWGPDARGGSAWKRLSQDVVLWYQPPAPEPEDPLPPLVKAATNPNSLAQAGNRLLLVDYDSQKVYIIGANELNGIPAGDHTLYYPPLDLGAAAPKGAGLPATARGQDIIAMKGPDGLVYAFALFIDNGDGSETWNNSTLVMMRENALTGNLEYVTHISTLGLNAQEIIPVVSDNSSVTFAISCYGGPQQEGFTNGTDSRIDMVQAFFTGNNMTTKTLVTGADSGTYDIRALAARLGGGWLYILCGTMRADLTQDWTLYKADLAELLAITAPMTLTQAVAANIMEMVDGGNDPGYYWDICIEAGIDITGDRLWFMKGSSIMVTGAEEYCDDVKNFNPGYGVGETGGESVNCVAFIAETLRQAAIGLSMKRGLVGSMIPIVSAAAQGETQKY
ncbi:MAG: hypothetical protein LBJ86_00145 [Spirochaetaceae bacterium]|nr:hypothetical protein [Spirochaetaceae bacterium]